MTPSTGCTLRTNYSSHQVRHTSPEGFKDFRRESRTTGSTSTIRARTGSGPSGLVAR